MKTAILNQKGTAKLFSGRLWLLKKNFARLPDFEPGEIGKIVSEEGLFLAKAYFNPKSRILARVLTRADEEIDTRFFVARFKKALCRRKEFFRGETCFRLIHGEGDLLPGLTIDIFDKVAVLQLATQGMERLKNFILPALKETLPVAGLVLRCDLPVRKEEGLELYVAHEGSVAPFWVKIDGLYFLIDPLSGQKTGFFLDQRLNRRKISGFTPDKMVFDLFCYNGAFALYAASSGAKKVLAVDRSKKALELAEENARKNRLLDRITFIQDDVENFLRYAPEAEVAILDPPAIIKHEKAKKAGLKRYEALNVRTIKKLGREGVFLSCSCSQFLSLEELLTITQRAAQKNNRAAFLFEIGLQAPDHPVYLPMRETLYLKAVFLRIEA